MSALACTGLQPRRAASWDADGPSCGHNNAFSGYEPEEARPLPAVVNLFRLLNKHPEQLAELTH
ncbi:type II toxin-antitoxin system MqsA family antitoxin [Lysobacter sp. A421]